MRGEVLRVHHDGEQVVDEYLEFFQTVRQWSNEALVKVYQIRETIVSNQDCPILSDASLQPRGDDFQLELWRSNLREKRAKSLRLEAG